MFKTVIMVVTDFVVERSYENNILTLVWLKSGIFKYKKKFGFWYNIEGVKQGFKQQQFLNEQFEKTQ